MKAAFVGAKTAPRPTPLAPGETARSLTFQLVLPALLLGLALFAYHAWVRSWPRLPMLVEAEISAFALMLCVIVARWRAVNDLRSGPFVLAVVCSFFLALTLQWLARWALGWPTDNATLARIAYATIENALLGGAGVFVWLHRRRDQRASTRMHEAQIARVQSSKRTLESRLQAMQARVEPRFLFNTLAQVKALYERDGALGERVLDELIAYLRAAMPRMRDTSSTVDQEVELVRAFLSIARLRNGGSLDFSIEVDEDARAARLPPMMLLPLVERVLHEAASGPVGGSIAVTICAEGGGLRARVEAYGLGAPPDPDDAMTALRERLQALYDRQASLVLRPRTDGSHEAVLDVPLEFNSHTGTRDPVPSKDR
jgi:hypothetical protein